MACHGPGWILTRFYRVKALLIYGVNNLEKLGAGKEEFEKDLSSQLNAFRP